MEHLGVEAVDVKEYFGLNDYNPDKIQSINDIYIKIPFTYDAKYLAKRIIDWEILNDHITFKEANNPNNYKTAEYSRIQLFVERLIFEIFGGNNEILNLGEDRITIDGFSMRVTYEENNISGYSFHCRVASDADVYSEDLVMPFGWYEMLMMKQKQQGGLWLFTGNMGSGKSTTIYAYICQYIKENMGEALTYEEPVEKILPEEINSGRIFQNNIPRGANWEDIGRRIRRFQPSSTGNIIFIGEINSFETARIAVSSALLGTNVISTIHGSSIKDVIYNLRDCLNNTANANRETTNNMIAQTLRFLSHQRIENNEHSEGRAWDVKKVVGDFLFNPFVEGDNSIEQMLRDPSMSSLSTILERQKNKMIAARKASHFNEKLIHTPISALDDAQLKSRRDSIYKHFIESELAK